MLAAAGAVLAVTRTGPVRRLDGWSLDVVREALGAQAVGAATALVDLGNPRQAVLLIAAALVVAALVARPARVVAIAVLLVGANGTGLLVEGCCEREVETEVFGIVLDVLVSAPSNHTMLVASVGLAAVMTVPRALLGIATGAAVGATGLMGGSLLVLSSHVLTDVAAAVLLVAGWAFVAAGVEPVLAHRLPARVGPLPLRRARVGVVVLGLLVVAWVFGHRADGRAEVVAQAVAERPAPVLAGVLLAGAVGAAVQLAAARRRGATVPPPG